MSASRLRKLAVSIATAAAVIGLGAAQADEGHWHHDSGRHLGWERHERWEHRHGAPVVVVTPPPAYYAPAPWVYVPPPVVYVPPPSGINLILPIHIR